MCVTHQQCFGLQVNSYDGQAHVQQSFSNGHAYASIGASHERHLTFPSAQVGHLVFEWKREEEKTDLFRERARHRNDVSYVIIIFFFSHVTR